ncbi:MAG: glycosyltransferase family 2 protein [Myxococcales bacterium]|nr:MAG: glycosyltransferase family 2 protein [Myxococcales bacterium]
MRLSVVVPCFNEEGNIARVVRQAAQVGRGLASELEIIVVDDGSTDDTPHVLSGLRDRISELRIISHPRNRGYGAAVRSGLDRASMEHVFLTDGDGQFDLCELPRAARLLGKHDVVVGYRMNRRDGWWRRLWGRAWTALVNRLFSLGVRDANCAFKLVPRSLVRSSDLRSDGALISAELLLEARRFDLSVGECPVSHYPRPTGRQSGASIRVILTAFLELAGCVARARPQKTPHASPRKTTSSPRGLAP